MEFAFSDNENYIFLNENIGTSSRNIGINKANSPICLLLDDDSNPFPGTVEKLIEEFQNLPDDCAGLISEIHNPDGGREATLLPTVFHGAGVAFKTDFLNANNILYPENYCFYGEEYRMTLEVYAAGSHLKKFEDFKVMHRRSNEGRDLKKIFYYLGRNNKAIWQDLVPEKYKEQVIYDSQRRYELTSQKENVLKNFTQGLDEELPSIKLAPMSITNFEKYSLIDKLKTLPDKESFILCGAGKFPSLWALELEQKNCQTYICDHNPGLIGKAYGKHTILSPDEALKLNGSFLIGHSSQLDFLTWKEILKEHNKEYLDLNSRYELSAI